MSNWLDIHSAPLDGTKVDLWRVHIEDESECERVTDCWFQDGNWLADKEYIFAVDGSSENLDAYWKITHWMPVPNAPPSE